MGNKRNERIDTNIFEIIWNYLEQWRLILIIAVIIGLLVSSYMYVRDVRNWQASAEQNNQIEEQTLLDDETLNPYLDAKVNEVVNSYLLELPEESRADVKSVYEMKSVLLGMQEYQEDSVAARIDPLNKHSLVLGYKIEVSEENQSYLQSLASIYKNDLQLELPPVLLASFDSSIEDKYASELVTVSATSDLIVGTGSQYLPTTLTINATIPDDMDVEQFRASVEQLINEKTELYSNTICPHYMTSIYTNDYVGIDYALLNWQADFENKYVALYNNLVSAENSLTAEQKAVYSKMIAVESENDAVLEEEQMQDAAIAEKPSFSLKWFFAGFILGIILYIILHRIYITLTNYIRNTEELRSGWNTRILGEVYHYNKKGLKRLIYSRNVFNMHHKKQLLSDLQAEKIVDSVQSMQDFLNIKDVAFVPVLPKTGSVANQMWESVWERISNALNEQSVTVKYCEVFEETDKLNERSIMESKALVPVVFSGESTSQMLDDLFIVSDFYNINVLGTIFVEG